MRILLDQGVPRGATSVLASLGHDAAHVGDVNMSEATDEAILDHAMEMARVVVTLDSDFHAIIAVAGRSAPSAIRVRIEGLTARPFAILIDRIAKEFQASLEAGCVLTVDETGARVRSLPIT